MGFFFFEEKSIGGAVRNEKSIGGAVRNEKSIGGLSFYRPLPVSRYGY